MNIRVTPIPTIFTALGLALLLGLGTWQTLRYKEKLRFEEIRDARAHLPILDANKELLASGDADLRQIRLQGKWQKDRLFLIKHRVYQGKPGSWIVSPFTLSGTDMTILVNRGWAPFSYDESESAHFLEALPDKEITLTGLLHVLDRIIPDEQIRAEYPSSASSPPKILALHTYDLDAMQALSTGPTLNRPIILTLSDDTENPQKYPLPGQDHITAPYLTSQTHLGYAITWFTLASALLAIWLATAFGLLNSPPL